jgi:hypothetical protein
MTDMVAAQLALSVGNGVTDGKLDLSLETE